MLGSISKKIPYWIVSAFIFSMVLVFSPVHASENATITGQVTDVDGLPIDDVTVSAEDVASATTDAGGFYTLEGVDADDDGVLVTFKKDGFVLTQGTASFRGPLKQEDSDDNEEEKSSSKKFKKYAKFIKHVKYKKAKYRKYRKYKKAKFRKYRKYNKRNFRKYRNHKSAKYRKYRKYIKARYIKAKIIKAIHESSREDDENENEEEFVELEDTILNKVMLPVGATQVVHTDEGGTFSEAGFSVTFSPDSFTVLGDIELVISPLDISTNEINAAPGDFSARQADGSATSIETFSMADFTLTQNGQPVNLKPGATAELELLLPENTELLPGESRSLWFFDLNSGQWTEEASGFVGTSTTMPGRLAVFATVTHFTHWGSAAPLRFVRITGRVVNASGDPISGAFVRASGNGYFSRQGRTDVNGNYTIQGRSRLNTTADITGGIFLTQDVGGVLSNLIVTSAPVTVTSDGTTSALVAPDIVIASAELSCISGDVLDAAGAPVVGATVFTTNGSFTSTDANGQFNLAAPANAEVRVISAGFPEVVATTGVGNGTCAQVAIRPGASPVGSTCVRGIVFQCNASNLRAGSVVEVFSTDETGPGFRGVPIGGAPTTGMPSVLLGTSAPSAADGSYCVDGLPSNTNYFLRSDGDIFGPAFANAGPVGATCATGGCSVGTPVDVFCF